MVCQDCLVYKNTANYRFSVTTGAESEDETLMQE
nr:MAG TPA: hypothetical protein [Caudoviricetes sp.]